MDSRPQTPYFQVEKGYANTRRTIEWDCDGPASHGPESMDVLPDLLFQRCLQMAEGAMQFVPASALDTDENVFLVKTDDERVLDCRYDKADINLGLVNVASVALIVVLLRLREDPVATYGEIYDLCDSHDRARLQQLADSSSYLQMVSENFSRRWRLHMGSFAQLWASVNARLPQCLQWNRSDFIQAKQALLEEQPNWAALWDRFSAADPVVTLDRDPSRAAKGGSLQDSQARY